MGIGISIFLAAVGAILTFAVTAEVGGINLDTVGVVLMVVGLLGAIAGYAMSRRDREEVHYHDSAPSREIHHHDESTGRER